MYILCTREIPWCTLIRICENETWAYCTYSTSPQCILSSQSCEILSWVKKLYIYHFIEFLYFFIWESNHFRYVAYLLDQTSDRPGLSLQCQQSAGKIIFDYLFSSPCEVHSHWVCSIEYVCGTLEWDFKHSYSQLSQTGTWCYHLYLNHYYSEYIL